MISQFMNLGIIRVTHVHETTVDVAELLETKKARAMSRVVESVALGKSQMLDVSEFRLGQD